MGIPFILTFLSLEQQQLMIIVKETNTMYLREKLVPIIGGDIVLLIIYALENAN